METKHTLTLRGNTATLVAHLPQNRRLTLPAFSHAQTNQLKRNANVFALALIRLWTASKSEHHEAQKIPFFSVSPETIHQQLLSGQSSNLGALTFLNLFMSNKDFPTSLSVLMNIHTSGFSFVQQGGRFWSDYIDPAHTYDFLATEGSLEQSLIRALSIHTETDTDTAPHAAWWQTALQGDDTTEQRAFTLDELFQFEIFETALRVFLTPMPMIEQLAQATLKQHDPDFNLYLFRKINQFKARFTGMLSEYQYEQWLLWIERRGLFHTQEYLRYVSQRRISFELMQNIVLNGIELSIPKLYHIISLKLIRNFSLNNKAQLFDYLIKQFEENWQQLADQPIDKLWLFTDELVICLNSELRRHATTIGIDPDNKSFLCHFMMTCMSLEKYSIIHFLLSQDDTLVHVPIQKKATLLPDDHKWANHSLLYFAQQQENTEMVELLKSKGARLLVVESREKTTNLLESKRNYFKRRPSFWELPQAEDDKNKVSDEQKPVSIPLGTQTV